MLSDVPVYRRTDLAPGARIAGPAVITEDATTTIVGPAFAASIDADGAIRLRREIGDDAAKQAPPTLQGLGREAAPRLGEGLSDFAAKFDRKDTPHDT